MSVPKGKRQQSRFEAQHHFYKLRSEVTALVLNDFGFSEEKYRVKMEHYRAAHLHDANIADICARWERKNESFKRWYVDEEGRRLKAYKHLIETGRMTYEDVEQSAKSWMGDYHRLMSKQQIRHMKAHYMALFGKELSWKRGSSSRTARKSRRK